MKVLFVASRYLPHLGGVENAVWNLSGELARLGHRVRIIAQRYPRTLPAAEVIDGVPVRRLLFLYPRVHQLQNRRPDLFAAGFVSFPATLLALQKELSTFRPDVVHLHFVGSAAPFLLALHRISRFKLIVTLHGDDVEGLPARAPLDYWLFRRLLDRAEAITACSRHLLDEALAIHPAIAPKARVVYNGVDLARFQGEQASLHPRPYVLTIGQLAAKKGFDVLLRAFATVVDEFPDVDLLIGGGGVERERLETLRSELRLAGRARLLGRVEPAEVVRLLKGSLFQVIPSRLEPFGIVALEGMAAGKAILATRAGGLPEFVDGSGLLVEPGSVEELVAGLRRLLRDEPLRARLAASGRQQVGRFAWREHIVPQYLEVYGG